MLGSIGGAVAESHTLPAPLNTALLIGKAGVRHGAKCVARLIGGNIDLDRLKGLL